MAEKIYRGYDYWSIIIAIVSLILFIISLFVADKLIILAFSVIFLSVAFLVYFMRKVVLVENIIFKLKDSIESLDKKLEERFNYIKDLQQIKVDLSMLKKGKKAQSISIIDLFKIIITIILIYVIIEVIRSLF